MLWSGLLSAWDCIHRARLWMPDLDRTVAVTGMSPIFCALACLDYYLKNNSFELLKNFSNDIYVFKGEGGGAISLSQSI